MSMLMLSQIVHNTFFNGDLLAGILFLVMGTLVGKKPPASRKAIFGYRTVLSTRNDDTWKEANSYAARYSVNLSLVLIPLGILAGIIFRTQSNLFYTITAVSVVVSALLLVGHTEWHLTRTFDEKGNRI